MAILVYKHRVSWQNDTPKRKQMHKSRTFETHNHIGLLG